MHQHWQDLMAFYVTGTLPPADAAALEDHLKLCEACRLALEEWYIIGGVVQSAASEWAEQTPPLAPALRANLPIPSANGRRPQQNAFDPASQTIMTPRARQMDRVRRTLARPGLSVTLAAASLIVVFFGGVVIMLLMGGEAPDFSGSSRDATDPPRATLGAEVSMLQPSPEAQTSATRAPLGTPSGGFQNNDLGMLPPPSATTGANSAPSIFASPVSPTPTPTEPVSAAIMPYVGGAGCVITNTSGTPLYLHANARSDQPITGTLEPGEMVESLVATPDGWYQVVIFRTTGRVSGWLNGAQAQLSGACESLPIPTPTIASPTPSCYAAARIEGSTVDLYAGPDRAYNVVITMNWSARVIERAVNGWYHVIYNGPTRDWNGWIDGGEVTLSGTCTNIPLVPINELPPAQSPTPTPLRTVQPLPVASPTSCAFFFGQSEGCPTAPESTTWAAMERFEGGLMVWREDIDMFYVLYADQTLGIYTGAQINPLPDNPVLDQPPDTRYKPVRGFGRVWGNFSNVRDRLGWALASEQGYTATVQRVNPASILGLDWYMSLPDGRVVALGPQFWRYAY